MKICRLFYFVVLALTLTAFAVGDYAELESLLNARAGFDFTKSAKNIKFQVPKGTVGKVLSFKKFHSGNYGVELDLQNGKNKGEKVFVYFTPGKPNISFSKENPLEKTPEKKSEVASVKPEDAQFAKIKTETRAYRAPSADVKPVVNPAEAADVAVIAQVQQGGEKLQKITAPAKCNDCEVAMAGQDRHAVILPTNGPVQNSKYEESIIREPLDQEVPFTQHSLTIGEHDRTINGSSGYYTAFTERQLNADLYQFQEDAERAKVHGFGLSRESNGIIRNWKFHFPAKSRQDIYLFAQDDYKKNVSDMKNSFIYFFPRKNLPSIQIIGNVMNVTLPTGELVQYDKNTKAIVGGVFSEKALSVENIAKSKGAGVEYTGSGVTVRFDGPNTEELRLGANKKSSGAIVSKGGKTCKVSSAELFPDQNENSKLNFKFKDDASFDSYLKAKCGFGID